MSFHLVDRALGELAKFKYGKFLAKSNLDSSGFPVFSGYGIVGYLPTYQFERPQLVIVCRGEGGTGDVKMSPAKCSITNLSIVLTPDETKVAQRFLFWTLRGSDTHRLRTGSAQAQIVIGSLEKLRVIIPHSIGEQVRIAQVLDELDDRIALLRETNATLEAIAQALFKSWFVDFDPVRAKQQGLAPAGMDDAAADLFPDSFEESALGPVPMGWPCIDLGELTQRCGGRIQTGPFGSQLHAKDYVDAGIPVVMPKDIVNRRVSTDSIARIGAADVERLARHKLQAGDIVFSRRGDVERHAPITEREVGWLCGTGCLLVRPGAHWQSPGFLSLLLDAPRARTWLVQHAVGATMPNLNTGILSSVPVVLPPAALLAAFDSLVAVTEVQRSSNASMAETLAEIRDTLLPRLISGQLRLPNVESVAT